MNKTLKTLLKRNIIHNIKQFMFVIVIVFLSMTLLSGFLVNSKTLDSAIDNYFRDTNLADAVIYTNKISDSDEQFYKENNINYEKRLEIETIASIKDSSNSKNAKVFVYDKGAISTPYIYSTVEGCWIDKNIAQNHNLIAGQDRVVFDYVYNIQTKDGEKVLNLKFDLLITGTMCLSECSDSNSCWPILIDKKVFLSELNKVVNAEISHIMSDITIEKITDVSYNQILIKSQDLENDKEKIVSHYDNHTDSKIEFILTQNQIESVVLLNSEVKQSKQMIYIFPIIFLFVSILVIMTTISQLILQERMKIGTLKSLGVSNSALLKHYSKYGAVLCFIGSILGLIVGPLLIPEIMFKKYDLIYSIPKEYIKLTYPIEILILISLLVVLMGYIVSAISCRSIVSKKPAWCLKSSIKGDLKSKNSSHKSKFPLPLKMAYRNLKIKPFRSIMASVGVVGCVALLLCGYGISDTLNNSLNNDFNKIFKYDISSEYVDNDFVEKLEDFEEIEDFETYERYLLTVSANNVNKLTNIYFISENSNFVSFKLAENDLILSQSIANDLNIKEGDYLTINCSDGIKNIKVTSLVETTLFNGVYLCFDIGFDQTNAQKGVWIKSNSNIETLISRLNKINGTHNAKSKFEIINIAQDKISSIKLITSTLKVFAITLAVVVLLNLVFLILKERNRDIATLKVLGQNLYIVALSIFFEILFISFIGIIFGIVLGFPLLVLVLAVNKVSMINYLYYISPLSFICSIVVVLITITFVCLMCLIRVKNIKMIEALKVME